MSHGLWKNSAVWIYLQNASQTPSAIPQHSRPSFLPLSSWGLVLFQTFYHLKFYKKYLFYNVLNVHSYTNLYFTDLYLNMTLISPCKLQLDLTLANCENKE